MSIEMDVKSGMQGVLEHFRSELKNLRSSRANSAMLDSVQVEVYGTQMKLRDVANITTPEPRQLLITPYDSSNVHAIQKGVEAANLNLLPIVDGNAVRINIPPMDEAMRKEIVKQSKRKAEEAKVSVREVRRKFNDQVRKEKSEGTLAEDQLKKAEKTIQELTDKFCKEIDQLSSEKEKEILAI